MSGSIRSVQIRKIVIVQDCDRFWGAAASPILLGATQSRLSRDPDIKLFKLLVYARDGLEYILGLFCLFIDQFRRIRDRIANGRNPRKHHPQRQL
jgi:hypothetical protein